MNWYDDYFCNSITAVSLQADLRLKFVLIEDPDLTSTAHTDFDSPIKVIRLNTSQSPLKIALSYAYELKNLSNKDRYEALIAKAKTHAISSSQFIHQMIRVEAEAAYFRCKVFYELGQPAESFPCNPIYLKIFQENRHHDESKVIEILAREMEEQGVVREQFAVKKYYADCYAHYAGKKTFPEFYNQKNYGPLLFINNQGTASNAPESSATDVIMSDCADSDAMATEASENEFTGPKSR